MALSQARVGAIAQRLIQSALAHIKMQGTLCVRWRYDESLEVEFSPARIETDEEDADVSYMPILDVDVGELAPLFDGFAVSCGEGDDCCVELRIQGDYEGVDTLLRVRFDPLPTPELAGSGTSETRPGADQPNEHHLSDEAIAVLDKLVQRLKEKREV